MIWCENVMIFSVIESGIRWNSDKEVYGQINGVLMSGDLRVCKKALENLRMDVYVN